MTGLPEASRRTFLFGACAAAGGLVATDSLVGRALSQTMAVPAKAGASPEVTAWIVIQPDNKTVIRVARSDMGQGALTSLPMLVAEELECDWAGVSTEFVSATENAARGRVWGDMVASNSISIRGSQEYLRKAGAQARSMLIAEAADRWKVPATECIARNSLVRHASSGRTIRFADIAQTASQRPIPKEVALKDPKDWHLLGTPARRLEQRPRVFGEPVYAIDTKVPDMLHAAVQGCPAFGGTLKSFDASRVKAMPGVTHVIPVGKDAVAVVAKTWWQAKVALDQLPVEWDESSAAELSMEPLRTLLRDGLHAADVVKGYSNGNLQTAFTGAARTVEVEYEAPFLAHLTMEPQTCTAHVTDAGVEVWAPTQNAEGTLNTVTRVLNIDKTKVAIHQRQLGGGFGRRGLAQDWAIQSVLIAKAVGQPVKMIWSREQDVTHDYYRPFAICRHKAAFDASGKLLGWEVRLCASSIFALLAPQFMRDGVDRLIMDGFVDKQLGYTIDNIEVYSARRNTAIPVGFWRAVNLSQNGYFRESFVDEMAEIAGKDPYQFRRELLRDNPRALAVLDEIAARANWGKAPAGVHQGIAIVEENASWCAEVVELSIDPEGNPRIHRVVAVLDSNFIVHPDIALAQMEGGIIQAISATLTGEVTFVKGRAQQTNFHDYPFLRMNEVPKIEIHLTPSLGKYGPVWGGIGETGVPPLAPALCNAIHAATGKRIRALPVKNHDLKAV
jgi:isoquinoline 1-oxidoreductase beta subunit